MARQDRRTRLVTQIAQVSGALEETFFYPEAEPYKEILQTAQEFFRALANYIMERERLLSEGPELDFSMLGEIIEPAGTKDMAGQAPYFDSELEGVGYG